MSYKSKNASENEKVVVYLCYSLLSNNALQLEETGPSNSSCSLACTAVNPLTFIPALQLAVTHSV